jgi:hypothetical protein
MSRAVSVALLTLAFGWVSLGFAQDLPPTPLNSQPVLPTAEQPRQRTLLELADEALAAGLSTTAAQLYTATLATPGLTSKERERASLGLAAGQIERTKTTEARETLKGLPDSPRKALYEGLLALLENDLPAATAAAEKADPEQLPVHESAWGHALRALIATAKGDSLGVNTHLANATRTAVSEEQRQRIEVLSFRASIIAGKVDDVTISVLRERASNAKGSPLAFAFSRNLALALARKDRRAEAVNALKEAAPLPDTRQAEADLLCGLILGYDSAEGRRFLQLAAKNPANPSVRLTALRALVAAAADAKPSDSKAIANEVYDFLMKRPDGQLSFECPRDPAVLDAIHLARAQLMLVAGNREKARQAASDLLKDVPASPLAREATRTLALTAWGDGSYRLASSFLNTLAEGKTGIPRDVLRTVSADCLFLAADYVLAEKAYAAIQNETEGADLATSAFHQRVLCALATAGDAKLWNHTAEIIESAQRNAKIPKERLWIAAWLLVEDARKANQTEEAARLLQRLNPLIARTNTDYALRFDWQRALIALANRDPSTAARLADDIARRLDDLPADASAELKVNAPKLRGHVALLKARTALGANSGKGLADLEALRKKYGKVPATASSYLVEGRHLAALGRHAEAQARFLALAKEFAGDATLTEFAELGLYEAAEEAARQAPVDGEEKLKESVELLEQFMETYPQSPLLFRVALRRAELLRSLGNFDGALLVLNRLIREKPDHPYRAQAEMARADALLGLAELRRDRKGELDRQRVAIAAGAYENVAIAWARDPDTLAEARYKLALALLERAKAESKSDAPGTRLEAKTVLVRALASLRQNGATDETSFGPTGRTWIASSILLLGSIHEEEGDTAEAIAVYRLIPELNRGLAPGESRLPGQGAAESKLASLRANGNNQKPR